MRERPNVRYVRRLLGRHDRWSHPMLAGVPRRSARRLAADGFAARFMQHWLRETYSVERISALVYAESPLLGMLKPVEAAE